MQDVTRVRLRSDGLHAVEVVWRGGARTEAVLQCLYNDPDTSDGLKAWLRGEWLELFNTRQHESDEVERLRIEDLECKHLSWPQLDVVFRGGELNRE